MSISQVEFSLTVGTYQCFVQNLVFVNHDDLKVIFFFFFKRFLSDHLGLYSYYFYYSMMIDEGEDGAGVGRRGGGSCCGFSSSSCRLQDRVFRVFCKAPWAFSLPVT